MTDFILQMHLLLAVIERAEKVTKAKVRLAQIKKKTKLLISNWHLSMHFFSFI